MDGIILAAILGSLAYLVWSMRRFLRSFREFIDVNKGEGTITSRLLPNLAFGALFCLLIYHTLLVDAHIYLGLPANMNFIVDFEGFNRLISGKMPVYDVNSGATIWLDTSKPQTIQTLEYPQGNRA